tara:strand:+ start:1803 stop:2021 length:219 start_codon:yes stop_codon:yes gene_type:complete
MSIPSEIAFVDNVQTDSQKNVIDEDVDIEQPYKTSFILVDDDATVDIEDGNQMSIGEGCILIIEKLSDVVIR